MLGETRNTAGYIFLLLVVSQALVLCLRQLPRDAELIDSDGRGYFAHLVSFAREGHPDYGRVLGELGLQQRNHWPVGTSLSWTPFYSMGRAASLVGESTGGLKPGFGRGYPEQLACCLGSIAYGSAAVALTFLLCCRWFDPRISLAATLAMFASTNLPYYLLCEPYMSHGISTFWVSCILYLGLNDRPPGHKTLAGLGVITGLAALTRPQDGLFLLVPICWHLTSPWRKQPKVLGGLILAGLLSLVVFSPQVAIWQTGLEAEVPTTAVHSQEINHSVSDGVVPGGRNRWLSPRLKWSLMGPECGLWLWHPATLAAVLGLLLLTRTRRRPAMCLLFGFLCQWYIVSGWGDQGQTYGARMMCSCFPLLVPGAACLLSRAFRPVGVLLATTTAWNLVLVMSYRLAIGGGLENPTLIEVLQSAWNR